MGDVTKIQWTDASLSPWEGGSPYETATALNPVRLDKMEIREGFLQRMLHEHPDPLPVAKLDKAFAPLAALRREIRRMDNLFVSPEGFGLTLGQAAAPLQVSHCFPITHGRTASRSRLRSPKKAPWRGWGTRAAGNFPICRFANLPLSTAKNPKNEKAVIYETTEKLNTDPSQIYSHPVSARANPAPGK